MSKKQKYYVVWMGVVPGIYASWDECKKQVVGFEAARYKSFATKQEAEAAWGKGYYIEPVKRTYKEISALTGEPLLDSVCVDAACSGNPGIMEYRGVETMEGAELFRMGPFPDGTNNVGEFLAIVHALALLKKMNSNMPVYSDSATAISWIRKGRANTKLERSAKNVKLFELIERAQIWLKENNFKNRLYKWETSEWGEIPADFGRK
ncbi:MAG: ribonuclease H family protein [Bacteroidota bacterium]